MNDKIIKTMKFTDLKEMLKKSGDLYGSRPAYVLRGETKNQFKIITHKEFRDEIDALGTTLIKMGLKNKRIAIIGNNRYEWCVSYLAVVAGTGIVVPLDKSLPDNEIEGSLIRSEVEAIIYSNKYNDIMERLQKQGNTKVKYFISMDLEEQSGYVYSQKELIKQGKELVKQGNTQFIDAKINSEEMGIMLFTSGTTAMSKIVMLSHKNICTNILDIRQLFELNETDRLLSFLPLHHTFECTVGFLYPISIGGSIAFCDGIRHIADNLKEYEITAMITVPALCEGIYKKIIKKIQKKGKYETVQTGIKISNNLLKVGIDVRKKLFKEIHDNFGGKLRLVVTGGAALDPMIEKGLQDLGINALQGYGLTETSPVIAAELTNRKRLGSIGKKFPSVDVKIDNPDKDGIGELIVKGPSVMLGYFKNDEENEKTLTSDGWMHTGDLARIDKDGFIFISGRQKNVIVLKNGKNIYPEELEAIVNKIEGIKETFVFGKPNDDDIKICAKVVYDKDLVKEIYNVEEKEQIYEKLWQEVKKINKTVPAYKYIRELIVTEEELIKTTTQKIRRHEELKKILM